MTEHRIIKPVQKRRVRYTSHISPEDLEWIGASEVSFPCEKCDKESVPLYVSWGNEGEYYCAKCLIEGWEDEANDR